MLQNGASQVFSVDVGTNQLAWKLRNDPRVVSMEQFNFRYAEPDDFEATPSFASIDVSFISLDLILPALHRILADNGQVVALVKPQFEAGREQIGKNGIIKDPKIHLAVLEKVAAFAGTHGFAVMGSGLFPYPRRPWQHRIFDVSRKKRRENKADYRAAGGCCGAGTQGI